MTIERNIKLLREEAERAVRMGCGFEYIETLDNAAGRLEEYWSKDKVIAMLEKISQEMDKLEPPDDLKTDFYCHGVIDSQFIVDKEIQALKGEMMGRMIDTKDLHNVVMMQKSEWGIFGVQIDNLIEDLVSQVPTVEVLTKDELRQAQDEMIDLSRERFRDERFAMGVQFAVGACIGILAKHKGGTLWKIN